MPKITYALWGSQRPPPSYSIYVVAVDVASSIGRWRCGRREVSAILTGSLAVLCLQANRYFMAFIGYSKCGNQFLSSDCVRFFPQFFYCPCAVHIFMWHPLGCRGTSDYVFILFQISTGISLATLVNAFLHHTIYHQYIYIYHRLSHFGGGCCFNDPEGQTTTEWNDAYGIQIIS